jgi:hypothetical protein
VFVSDDVADKQAVQPMINQILAYPLSKYDGKMKIKDWAQAPKFPSANQGDEETRWVVPEKFFDELPRILDELPPLRGEEAARRNLDLVVDAPQREQFVAQQQ